MSKKLDRVDARTKEIDETIKEIDQLLWFIDWFLVVMVSAPIMFLIVMLGLIALKWLGYLQ